MRSDSFDINSVVILFVTKCIILADSWIDLQLHFLLHFPFEKPPVEKESQNEDNDCN